MCDYCDRHSQRAADILGVLRSGSITSNELAERLNVSPRTIYREIARLRGAGHRIIGEAGAGYLLRERQVRHG